MPCVGACDLLRPLGSSCSTFKWKVSNVAQCWGSLKNCDRVRVTQRSVYQTLSAYSDSPSLQRPIPDDRQSNVQWTMFVAHKMVIRTLAAPNDLQALKIRRCGSSGVRFCLEVWWVTISKSLMTLRWETFFSHTQNRALPGTGAVDSGSATENFRQFHRLIKVLCWFSRERRPLRRACCALHGLSLYWARLSSIGFTL